MLFAQSIFMPDQASTVAPQVDALFFGLVGLSAFFTVLIAALVIYFALRYRRRSEDEYPTPMKGSMRLEIVWSVIPLVILISFFFWGANVYFTIARPPDDALEVYVVGRQWMWKMQHPGGQREINTLHIPVDQPVKVVLTSEDVIHSFFVPDFRTKQDAVPGRYTHTWFTATKPGRYRLFCAEYCGTEHAKMIGWVIAMEQADYQDWLDQGADGSMATHGRQLFYKLQCITCHTGEADGRGPALGGIYQARVPLADGTTVIANESYLRESILNPTEKVVAGYQPIMPTYQGKVDEMEMLELIAFLKSLKPGQVLPRVEDTPTPAPIDLDTRMEKK